MIFQNHSIQTDYCNIKDPILCSYHKILLPPPTTSNTLTFNYNNCCSLLDTSYKLIIFISLVPNNGFLIIKKVCVWVSLNGNVGIYLYKLIDRISNLIPHRPPPVCGTTTITRINTFSICTNSPPAFSICYNSGCGQLFMLVVDAHAL